MGKLVKLAAIVVVVVVVVVFLEREVGFTKENATPRKLAEVDSSIREGVMEIDMGKIMGVRRGVGGEASESTTGGGSGVIVRLSLNTADGARQHLTRVTEPVALFTAKGVNGSSDDDHGEGPAVSVGGLHHVND